MEAVFVQFRNFVYCLGLSIAFANANSLIGVAPLRIGGEEVDFVIPHHGIKGAARVVAKRKQRG